MTVSTRFYTVAVYEAEPDEGGYWCEVLELPGCVAQGETLDELRAAVADAIQAWEETVQELGDQTEGEPQPRKVLTWTLPVDAGSELCLLRTSRGKT